MNTMEKVLNSLVGETAWFINKWGEEEGGALEKEGGEFKVNKFYFIPEKVDEIVINQDNVEIYLK